MRAYKGKILDKGLVHVHKGVMHFAPGLGVCFRGSPEDWKSRVNLVEDNICFNVSRAFL